MKRQIDIDYQKVSERIKNLIDDKKVVRNEMAIACNITRETLFKKLNNMRKKVDLEFVVLCSLYLDVELEYLLFGEDYYRRDIENTDFEQKLRIIEIDLRDSHPDLFNKRISKLLKMMSQVTDLRQ